MPRASAHARRAGVLRLAVAEPAPAARCSSTDEGVERGPSRSFSTPRGVRASPSPAPPRLPRAGSRSAPPPRRRRRGARPRRGQHRRPAEGGGHARRAKRAAPVDSSNMPKGNARTASEGKPQNRTACQVRRSAVQPLPGRDGRRTQLPDWAGAQRFERVARPSTSLASHPQHGPRSVEPCASHRDRRSRRLVARAALLGARARAAFAGIDLTADAAWPPAPPSARGRARRQLLQQAPTPCATRCSPTGSLRRRVILGAMTTTATWIAPRDESAGLGSFARAGVRSRTSRHPRVLPTRRRQPAARTRVTWAAVEGSTPPARAPCSAAARGGDGGSACAWHANAEALHDLRRPPRRRADSSVRLRRWTATWIWCNATVGSRAGAGAGAIELGGARGGIAVVALEFAAVHPRCVLPQSR